MTAKQAKTELKVGIRPLEQRDKRAIHRLTTSTAAINKVYDFSRSDLDRIFAAGPVGYVAALEGEKELSAAVLGYRPENIPSVWQDYLGDAYREAGLPEQYRTPGTFYLEVVASKGRGKREIAGELVERLSQELAGAGYERIVTVADSRKATGLEPGELGFKPKGKLPHFWVYPGVDDDVTVFERELAKPAKK